jgi:hypothetical protein
MLPQPLHVVGVYYNHRPDMLLDPRHTRLRLLHEWTARLLDTPDVDLTIVEHTIGERQYELSPEDPRMRHVRLIQVRGGAEQEVWLSWALLNVGFARLPDSAQYLCWQDTDIMHYRNDWATCTVDMLQLHRVGQTWTDSIDVGPRGEQVPDEWGNMVNRSFSAAWRDGDIPGLMGEHYGQSQSLAITQPQGKKKDMRAHPGYSSAIRKSALAGIGRLIDWDITGSSDWHMYRAFAGLPYAADPRMSAAFTRKHREFIARCDEYIRQDIGVVPGIILAGWHGRKRDRYYVRRNEVLLFSGFDPDIDITPDVNGIPTLVADNRPLRDGIRRYNMMRNEDSIDV